MRFKPKKLIAGMSLGMLSMFAATSAQAADGCKFLLCIAGPWSSISQCVSTVHEVFRDIARGRPIPTCDMGGSDNTATNTWINDEASCPSMYRQYGGENNNFTGCTYPARISVSIGGRPWSQVYWNMQSNSSTWYSDAARASLTQQPDAAPVDEAFLNDMILWNTPRVAQCRSTGGTLVFDAFGALERCINQESGSGGGAE